MRWQGFIAFALLISALVAGAQAQSGAVWIDVRSAAEHLIDNIEGDPRIPYDEVASEVPKLYPDKSADIRFYCAVGGRAGKAAEALRDAGYTNVSNAGGIDDARRARSLEE